MFDRWPSSYSTIYFYFMFTIALPSLGNCSVDQLNYNIDFFSSYFVSRADQSAVIKVATASP